MKIHELKELTNLSLLDISNKTLIPYKRVLKLNKQTLEHSSKDYDLINNYLNTRGQNVIKIDFKANKSKRLPFSFEKRKEIDLNVYKLNKRRQERAERKEQRLHVKRKLINELRLQEQN